MTDLFAVLGLPRTPWLDPDEIKERHHAAMASAHPDKSSSDAQSATILNEARRVLENPALRLRHLLVLEFPDQKPAAAVPNPDWDFFQKTGAAAKLAQDLSTKLRAATQPLVRATLLARVGQCIATLESLQKETHRRREALLERLRALSESPLSPTDLQSWSDEWTFLERTETSLREARLRF
jgi:curved DNA-binding protein CbpA